MRLRSSLVRFVLAASLAHAASEASAHTFLARSSPAVGATVEQAPQTLRLEFSEDVEAALSSVEILDAASHEIETPPPEHPASGVLLLRLPVLAAGTYTVRWKGVSIDTHATEGSFHFTVGAP